MQDEDDKAVENATQGSAAPDTTDAPRPDAVAGLARPLPEHVNAPITAEGNAYLHELCRQNATPALLIDAVKVLGAMPDLPNKAGLPPIAYAITQGDAAMVSCLRKLGANIVNGDFNAILYAVDANKPEALAVLLRSGRGHGVNTNGLLTSKEKGSDTPLITALSIQRDDMIGMLLDAGALTDARRQRDGAAALHLAAIRAQGEHVGMLLAAGADPLQKNHEGMTPMHVAAAEGRVESIRLLIEYGVDVDIKNAQGQTALHIAALNKRLEVVKYLLAAGADINAVMPEMSGDSALHAACRRGYDEVALELIGSGADVLLQNNDRQTPLAVTNKDANRPFYDEVKRMEDHHLQAHFERAHRRLMDEKRDSRPKSPPYFFGR